jgi:hypothetical protein
MSLRVYLLADLIENRPVVIVQGGRQRHAKICNVFGFRLRLVIDKLNTLPEVDWVPADFIVVFVLLLDRRMCFLCLLFETMS